MQCTSGTLALPYEFNKGMAVGGHHFFSNVKENISDVSIQVPTFIRHKSQSCERKNFIADGKRLEFPCVSSCDFLDKNKVFTQNSLSERFCRCLHLSKITE